MTEMILHSGRIVLQEGVKRDAPPGLGDGFHTVGLEWTPTRYTMFVDGKTTWTTDGPISHTPEYVIFSLEVGPWAKNIADANLPDDFLVDYIRIYQKPDDDKSIINITPE